MYACGPLLPVSRDVGSVNSCPGHQMTCALTSPPHHSPTHHSKS